MFRKLYFQVLVAIVAGVLLGHYAPAAGVAMKPFGDAFIALVRMLIAPIIFCTVVTGIAGVEDMKSVGRTGGLALVYFEVVSGVALVVGLLVGNVVHPGAGLNIDPRSLDTSALAPYAQPATLHSVPDFLLGLIPSTLVEALARGDILQVLTVSVLFGFALHAHGGRDSGLFKFIEQISSVLFGIVAIVMRVAPLGAFGAMAFTIGRYGLGTLASLAGLLVCFYATCLVFVLGVLGVIARAHGFRVTRLIAYLREELLIVLGTSSSESVLPRMLVKLEALGVRKAVVDLVIPAGYSFNLDGTSIYLTLAVLFIAQATNTPLALPEQLLLLLVLLLTSKGAAGVTGSGFIVLAATLSSTGTVPVAGLALIFGVDRFMSQARALTNLVGNAVATVVVGRWTRELDRAQLDRTLARGSDGPVPPP